MAPSTTGYSAPPPPAQYDHAYTGKLAVYDVTPEQFSFHCKYTAEACAFSFNNYSECHIYIKQGTRYSRASLMRHELGHCNGWPGSHPYYAPERSVTARYSQSRIYEYTA